MLQGTTQQRSGISRGNLGISSAQNDGQDGENNQCSDISIYSQASADSLWQQSNLGEYKQLNLLKLIPTHNQSCDRTSQEYQFTLISETISLIVESLTLLPADFPALARVTQELEQVLSIQPQLCGKKVYEQVEQLPQDKQPSPSAESFISIPCLVKQPKQLEVKGVIKKDKGDRFNVEVDGEEISISKLFVYPDFSTAPQGHNIKQHRDKSVGQIEKSPSKISTPSKTRRRKGEGNGSIHWRTVTRNGKEYRQAYYHWVEGGKKRTKYIPKKLLDRVTEAESRKLPIADILILLGGKKINPSKSSDTFVDKYGDNSESNLEISPSKITPPSTRKRKQGEGTGYIECKPIKRSGKEYRQYWYHYEEWQKGDRKSKKSLYIPKRLVARVQTMEAEKAPVNMILEVLISKDKRSKK